MPSNSAEYQKQHRIKNKAKWKEPSIRLSLEQHKAFSSYAKKQGMSLSSLMRLCTELQIQSSTMKSKEVLAEIKQLRFLIANFTNNLNQIAHHSNEVKQVLHTNEVFELIRGLEESITDFVDAKMNDRS